MADPIACYLFHVRFTADVDIVVAAPVGTSEDEVLTLARKEQEEILNDVMPEWSATVSGAVEGESSDTNRHTWIVNDDGDGFVKGEETEWFPEVPRG